MLPSHLLASLRNNVYELAPTPSSLFPSIISPRLSTYVSSSSIVYTATGDFSVTKPRTLRGEAKKWERLSEGRIVLLFALFRLAQRPGVAIYQVRLSDWEGKGRRYDCECRFPPTPLTNITHESGKEQIKTSRNEGKCIPSRWSSRDRSVHTMKVPDCERSKVPTRTFIPQVFRKASVGYHIVKQISSANPGLLHVIHACNTCHVSMYLYDLLWVL